MPTESDCVNHISVMFSAVAYDWPAVHVPGVNSKDDPAAAVLSFLQKVDIVGLDTVAFWTMHISYLRSAGKFSILLLSSASFSVTTHQRFIYI